MENLYSKERIEVVLKREEEPYTQENEISLREIIEAIWRGKKTIAIITIAAMIFAFFGTKLISPYGQYQAAAQTLISFNYQGIEEGLDPYGRKFDIGKIKSPIVLDRVIEEMQLDKLNITVDDIRSNIELEPVVPGEITQKIKTMIENVDKGKENIEALENYTYYPNQYVVNFYMPKSMDLDESKAPEILNAIISSYTTYFYDTYTDRSVLSNALGKINYNEYDYPDVSYVIRSQINTMKSYLTAKNREASDFRSKETGLSFGDIIQAVTVIDSIDLSRLDSLIGAYKLTKDKQKLINTLEYRIRSYELQMAKEQDESKKTNELLSSFQKEKNIIFTGGAGNPEGLIETEKPSPLYDDLTTRSLETGVSATNITHEINFIKQQIALFQAEDALQRPSRRIKPRMMF